MVTNQVFCKGSQTFWQNFSRFFPS